MPKEVLAKEFRGDGSFSVGLGELRRLVDPIDELCRELSRHIGLQSGMPDAEQAKRWAGGFSTAILRGMFRQPMMVAILGSRVQVSVMGGIQFLWDPWENQVAYTFVVVSPNGNPKLAGIGDALMGEGWRITEMGCGGEEIRDLIPLYARG